MHDLAPSGHATTRTFCTFRVQERLCGIEAEFVREVSTHIVTTPVPQAPLIVRGLANLRSRIFLVLNLRAAMGMPQADCTPDSRLIVLQTRTAENVGLLVDRVGEILRVAPEAIEAGAPATEDAATTSSAERSALVTGVCKLENELMLIIDPARVIEATEAAIR